MTDACVQSCQKRGLRLRPPERFRLLRKIGRNEARERWQPEKRGRRSGVLNMDCKNCYWHGKCPENEFCEDFTPIDDGYLDEEYAADLEERQADYIDFIIEMDS